MPTGFICVVRTVTRRCDQPCFSYLPAEGAIRLYFRPCREAMPSVPMQWEYDRREQDSPPVPFDSLLTLVIPSASKRHRQETILPQLHPLDCL